ncbi:unannotated protein [freshwater metagenome]|uniref:Unannotated protein n=1 Tax=freshwater metagenome TaxID=449393 RepID=A0A6J6IEW7_9ZZZZ
MVFATSSPEVIHVIEQPFRIFRNAILERWRTPSAVNGSFSRCTIVARDVHEQGVVGLSHFFDCIKHATNLSIGVRHETGEHFHKTRRNRLITVRVFLPRWHFIGTWRECCSLWDDTKSQLTLINLATQFIPALVKLALEFFNPLGCHMVRTMHCARGDVGEERPLWLRCLLNTHP